MSEPLNERLRVVQELVKTFRFERYVYLGTNSLAVIMLLLAAGKLLLQNKPDIAVLTALFGSSGLIAFSLGRLLKMWDQAVKMLFEKE